MELGLSLSLTGVRGGFSLAAFMASQSAGFWIKGDDPTTLFQGTDESTPVTAFSDVVGRANDQRVGAGSPISSTQSTTSFKPKYQSTGLAFDGTDDNLLTNYTAGSGANFLIAKVVVPASVASARVAVGASGADFAGRIWLGIDSTIGAVGAGIGNRSSSIIRGATSLLGQTVVIGVSCDGATVRLFSGQSQAYEAAQAGTLSTSVGMAIGALNAGGTMTGFWPGSVQHALAGREFIDLARFNQIANALGA